MTNGTTKKNNLWYEFQAIYTSTYICFGCKIHLNVALTHTIVLQGFPLPQRQLCMCWAIQTCVSLLPLLTRIHSVYLWSMTHGVTSEGCTSPTLTRPGACTRMSKVWVTHQVKIIFKFSHACSMHENILKQRLGSMSGREKLTHIVVCR